MDNELNDFISKLIDDSYKLMQLEQEKRIINDIIDIYKGKYNLYEDYIQHHQNEIDIYNELIRQNNFNGKLSNMFILPPAYLLSKDIYEYIKLKGGEENG